MAYDQYLQSARGSDTLPQEPLAEIECYPASRLGMSSLCPICHAEEGLPPDGICFTVPTISVLLGREQPNESRLWRGTSCDI